MNPKLNILKKNTFLIGIILGFFFLYQFSNAKKNKANYEELALGQENSLNFGAIEKKRIHCQDSRDLDDCVLSYQKYGKKYPITLWLGNSQIHAMNQYKIGEETAPVKLHKLASSHKQYVISLSQPNANLQEHYLILSHLINKLPVKNLILPVVFDDMRENGIRYNLKHMMHDNNTLKILNRSSFGKKIIKDSLNKNSNDIIYNDDEKSLEKFLGRKLSLIWSLWEKRDFMRNELFNLLYISRNFIFQIESTTTRKMLIGHYEKNYQALEEILKLTNDFQVKTFVYIAPIRNDIKIPYKLKDYEKLKSDLDELKFYENVLIKNLENIIPNHFWGSRLSTNLSKNEVDFMHFKEAGHTILSKNIYLEVVKTWEE